MVRFNASKKITGYIADLGHHGVGDGADELEDYRRTVKDGLLLDDAGLFDALLERCHALAEHVNAGARASTRDLP